MSESDGDGGCVGDVLSWGGLLSKTCIVWTYTTYTGKKVTFFEQSILFNHSGVSLLVEMEQWGDVRVSFNREGKGSCSWKEYFWYYSIPRAFLLLDDAFTPGTAWCVLKTAVPAPKILNSHLPELERSASKVYIYREQQGCSQECIPCGCLRRYILVTVPIQSNNMNRNEISATHLIQHISISNLYFVKNIESIIRSLQ